MSGGLLKYIGLVTKVRAMGAKLMSPEDYEKIVNFDTVSEMVLFLKQKPGYTDIYANVDENSVHRGEIERDLVNSLYLDYAKVFRFAGIKQRKAIAILFFRFEVDILKSCLKSFQHLESPIDLSLFNDFFRRHSSLKLEKLTGLNSIEELIQNLADTKYYDVLTAVHNQPEATLFDYQTQLDIFYFNSIWKQKDKILKGEELLSFTNVLGTQIDLLNIQWIYRFKLYYAAESTKINRSVIPIYFKLTKKQLSALVEVSNIEEMMGILDKSYYKELSKLQDVDLEKQYRKIVHEIYLRNCRKYPNSMAPILGFLHLKEQEINKLTTALECVRYKINPEESLAMLKD